MAKKAKVAPFKEGDMVVFKGYGEDVPEDQQFLEEGAEYEVFQVVMEDQSVIIQVDNPSYNPKKAETDENSKLLEVDAFFSEVELAPEGGDQEDEKEEPVTKAEDKGKAKTKEIAEKAPAAKGKAKAKKDDTVEDVPEKSAAKVKAAPKGKAKAEETPKGKSKLPAKTEASKEEEGDEYPALDKEDETILELVGDSEDLLDLASELVGDAAALEYKIGGVLYHLRLQKEYQNLDPKYAEKKGWETFLDDKLPGLGYRKAMHLVEIYYKVNLFGIDPDKVQELGWTKFSKIVRVMKEDNVDELLELAEASSVVELVDTIKDSYKEVGGTKGEMRKKTTFKFRLWEDQAEGCKLVLAHVCSGMGFKDESDAFEHILMEWAAEHEVMTSTPKEQARAVQTEGKQAKTTPAAKGKAKAKA